MTTADYLFIILFLVGVTAFGLVFARRSSGNTTEFIVAGRKLPWWLAGTSMIAGSFNADSPLHQSGKIRQSGIAGNWFYWSEIPGQILGALLFGPLWRRTGVQTAVEFYNLRYSAGAGKILRIYSAFHVAIFEGCIFAAIGLIGLRKVAVVLFDLPDSFAVAGISIQTDLAIVLCAVLLALAYSTAAGLWGVVWTDLVEFIIAMCCSWLLAVVVLGKAGWGTTLRERIVESPAGGSHLLEWLPQWGPVLFVYLILRPILGAAGTNATNQRYLAVRDEREAVISGAWRIINHFVIRAWPWYICGLASVVLIPDVSALLQEEGLSDREQIYPLLIREYMPAGLMGLMIAGFMGAFMSSIDTTIHSSAAIITNDLYRPYVRPAASERHYLLVARLSILLVTALDIVVALKVDSILNLLGFAVKVIQAMGIIAALRWFWWRVNAWSELAAYGGSMGFAFFIDFTSTGRGLVDSILSGFGWSGWDARFSVTYTLIALATTLMALAVTWMTHPEKRDVLDRFYRRVRPPGFWGPVARALPEISSGFSLRTIGILWCAGMVTFFSSIFFIGLLVLGYYWQAALALGLFIAGGTVFTKGIRQRHLAS